MCSLVFGLAVAHLPPSGQGRILINLLSQLREVFCIIMSTLIRVAPLGLVCLMGGAVATATSGMAILQDAGVLLVATACSYAMHTFIFIPLLLFVLTGRNPYTYLARFRTSYRKAFRTSSAEEALEKTVVAAVESGEVTSTVAGFVLPLGIDLNLDGSGLYYPLAVLFLGQVSGHGEDVTPGTLVVISLVSTLSSIGAHVMPNGGLILLLAIWAACFNGVYKVPVDIAYLLALQWLYDRLNAVTSIVTDAAIAKIVDVTTDARSEMRKAQQSRAKAAPKAPTHSSKRRSLWENTEGEAQTPGGPPAPPRLGPLPPPVVATTAAAATPFVDVSLTLPSPGPRQPTLAPLPPARPQSQRNPLSNLAVDLAESEAGGTRQLRVQQQQQQQQAAGGRAQPF